MGASQFDISIALQELGDPVDWKIPTGYRNSLALCAIDAIWSIGIRYSTVERVLDRYLALRGLGGLKAAQDCTDGPVAFLEWCGGLDGPDKADALADALGNRNRTSSRSGVLKADAVIEACELLSREGIESTKELLEHEARLEELWRSEIPGQKSGISWKYLLMLAGQAGVKPDRMIHRFMKRMGAPPEVTPEQFVDQIVFAVNMPEIDARVVDHRIWTIERSRPPEELSSIESAIQDFVKARDWEQFHTNKNLVLALTSEVGEVADIVRWKTDEELHQLTSSVEGRQRLGEELADVFIFLVRTAQVAGVDLASATLDKIDSIDQKYPVESSRGNARKHNER